MASVTLYINGRDETAFEIDGFVETGGSNAHGSDEPAWADVTIESITFANGNPVSERYRRFLTESDYDVINDAIRAEYGFS